MAEDRPTSSASVVSVRTNIESTPDARQRVAERVKNAMTEEQRPNPPQHTCNAGGGAGMAPPQCPACMTNFAETGDRFRRPREEQPTPSGQDARWKNSERGGLRSWATDSCRAMTLIELLDGWGDDEPQETFDADAKLIVAAFAEVREDERGRMGQAQDEERPTAAELLRHGGEWLGAARKWLQWNTRNGSSVTWSSGDLIEPQLSVRQIEDLAAEVAAAAMRPQPSEQRLSQALKARWKAEAEVERLRMANPSPKIDQEPRRISPEPPHRSEGVQPDAPPGPAPGYCPTCGLYPQTPDVPRTSEAKDASDYVVSQWCPALGDPLVEPDLRADLQRIRREALEEAAKWLDTEMEREGAFVDGADLRKALIGTESESTPSTDPVRQTFEQDPMPGQRPLTEEQQAKRARGLADMRAGRFVDPEKK